MNQVPHPSTPFLSPGVSGHRGCLAKEEVGGLHSQTGFGVGPG